MLDALRFLTVFPGSVQAPGRWVVLFPIIGAMLGWLGASTLPLFAKRIGEGLAILIVLVILSVLTGVRQERGVMRVLGQIGIIALALLIMIRWNAIRRMPAEPVAELVTAFALSRAAMVAIAFLSRPIGDDARLGTHMTIPGACVAMGVAIVIAFSIGRQGVITACAAAFATSLLVQWFDQTRGGIDTAGLHAASLFIETLCLAVISSV